MKVLDAIDWKHQELKMPKGSVGITEQFANIYTFESPGGWNIIGNTQRKFLMIRI